jgi:hypothetical protein
MLMAASLLSQSAPADDPAGILPMRLLLRELCPDAFAPIEARMAAGYGQETRTTGEVWIGGVQYEEFETVGPAKMAFASPVTFARLAAALEAQLASGAVDRWLAGRPDVAVSREQVAAHLDYLRRDRGEVPKPGETLIWRYELPLPGRH